MGKPGHAGQPQPGRSEAGTSGRNWYRAGGVNVTRWVQNCPRRGHERATRGDVPYPDDPVLAAGGQALRVMAEGDAPHRAPVLGQCADERARLDVQQASGASMPRIGFSGSPSREPWAPIPR